MSELIKRPCPDCDGHGGGEVEYNYPDPMDSMSPATGHARCETCKGEGTIETVCQCPEKYFNVHMKREATHTAEKCTTCDDWHCENCVEQVNNDGSYCPDCKVERNEDEEDR